MMKHYLLGCGGHGRVVIDSFLKSGQTIDGIIDPGIKLGENIFGIPVIGDDNLLEPMDTSCNFLINGFGVIKGKNIRREFFERYSEKGFTFKGVVFPGIIIGAECLLHQSCQIMAGVVLQNRVKIGKNSVVNTLSGIDHDCVIGDHVFISPGVTVCGDVTIENGAFIGAGSVILPGIKIEENAVVGAGSLVRQDIRAGKVVAGNPARDFNFSKDNI